MDELERDFERIRGLVHERAWPGMEESTSYGTPSLKVKGRFLLRIREPGIAVLKCDMDRKEFLMQAVPEIFFETDHYRGWPGVLIRLAEIEVEDLAAEIEKSWRELAPRKLVAEFDARR